MLTRSITLGLRGLPLAIGMIVASLVCAHGIPLLRHDWALPQLPDALRSAWETLFQPWVSRGMGEPDAYPTAYLVGLVTWPLTFLPPMLFTWLIIALIVASAAGAALAIARELQASAAMQIACALFAALNPWVYTELVAGHVFMVMSYGFLCWLTAEIVRDRPRTAWLVLWSALLVCQIEFLTFIFVPITIWLLWKRHYFAFVSLCVAILPILFGIAAHYNEVRQTPFLLEWQDSQSVAALSALTLRGYFAHYAASFGPIALSLWVVAITAAATTILAIIRKSPQRGVLILGWAAMAGATGTKWVFAPLYRVAVLHIPEIGVFRELYDLLALVTVAYVVTLAMCGKSQRFVSTLLLVACASLAYAWIAAPPFEWFVAQESVPSQRFPGSDHERVALFPAIQPLKLRNGGGSGYDPDLYYQPGRAIPLNSYFPAYPQVGALEAAQGGNIAPLEALSVRYVISRPYLEESTETLRYEMILPHRRLLPPTQTLASPYPLLGLLAAYPDVVGVGQAAAGNGVFFGDAPAHVYGSLHNAWFQSVRAPRLGTDAQNGWIDARLAYVSYPMTATQFGGAFTRSRAVLPISEHAQAVLAWTSATMLDDSGRIIARRSYHLRWWPLRRPTHYLRCNGTCTVSAVGKPPPVPNESPARMPHGVAFVRLTPWLTRASLPQHDEATLRWNVLYQDSWTLIGTPALAHIRLNGNVNGWLLPRASAASVYVINLATALQLLLEILSGVVVAVLIALAVRYA